jgi:hypothetical protein
VTAFVTAAELKARRKTLAAACTLMWYYCEANAANDVLRIIANIDNQIAALETAR